mmetsp:Transcript_102184/g.286426  ORF Transcript_102184/g.286426 Transcript_102184/m.286426 type:complete len:353 (+) Transcript_102184:208-1266(+)
MGGALAARAATMRALPRAHCDGASVDAGTLSLDDVLPLADCEAGLALRPDVLGDAVLPVLGEVREEVGTAVLVVAGVQRRVSHDDGARPGQAGLLQQLQVRDEALLGVVAEDEIALDLLQRLARLREALLQAVDPRLHCARQHLDLVLHARVLDDAGGDGREERVHLDADELAAVGQLPGDSQGAVAAICAELDRALRSLVRDRLVEEVLPHTPRRRPLHLEVCRPKLIHRRQQAVHVALLHVVYDMLQQLPLAPVHEGSPLALLAHLHDCADGLGVDDAAPGRRSLRHDQRRANRRGELGLREGPHPRGHAGGEGAGRHCSERARGGVSGRSRRRLRGCRDGSPSRHKQMA